MNTAFPFGLPPATALYASFYALTLALHALLVAYVLAGTGWVAVDAVLRLVRGRRADRAPEPAVGVAALFRDWLPFAVGGAITLGVAPLLFLQILYRETFYTAGLLLFWRWMAIVPALVVGFYALYLAKTERLRKAGPAWRALVAVTAFGSFAFVAFSFADQHTLALARGAWVGVFRDGPLGWHEPIVLLRVCVWLAGAPAVAVGIVGWQLRAAIRREAVPYASEVASRQVRALAAVALVGLAGAAAFAWLYRSALPADDAAALVGPLSLPWLVLALGGAGLVVAGAGASLWRGALGAASLALVSVGGVLLVLGAVAAREALRLSHVEPDALVALHERAARASGMLLFVAFLALNAGVIAAAVVLVRRGLRSGPSA